MHMHPIDSDLERVLSFNMPAPFGFGQHPDFEAKYRAARAQAHKWRGDDFKKLDEAIMGKEVSLSGLADSRHPEVHLIPRNDFLYVVDGWGDAIGFERTAFPFSSTDFYVDIDDEKSLFYEFGHSEAFFRLGKINQLGYLVPPRPEEWDKEINISYLVPQFPHTRWIHSLLVAILMEVILARNGFAKEERNPMVLAAGSHDVAIPAGGDSIKRVDPKNLHEEDNFSWVLERYGLAKKWAKQFGFSLTLAKEWVRGKGVFGRLLDAIDKICYTALDCLYLGTIQPGQVRNLCLKYPLIMDVWQDIRFTPDKNNIFFDRPERLYRLLLLRAYEYQELLFNPYCRSIDIFLKKLVKPLYKKGVITKEQLITNDDQWLMGVLKEHCPKEIEHYIELEKLTWRKFDTAEERRKYCKKFKVKADHTEHIAGFDTGLDWLTLKRGEIMPLRQAISRAKVKLLEEVVASTVGYYVYYKRP